MSIAASLVLICVGVFAIARSIDRITQIEPESEAGPFFDNVIAFPVRRQS